MQDLHGHVLTAELTSAEAERAVRSLRDQIVKELVECGWDFQEASEDVFRALIDSLRSDPDQTIFEWYVVGCRRFGIKPPLTARAFKMRRVLPIAATHPPN